MVNTTNPGEAYALLNCDFLFSNGLKKDISRLNSSVEQGLDIAVIKDSSQMAKLEDILNLTYEREQGILFESKQQPDVVARAISIALKPFSLMLEEPAYEFALKVTHPDLSNEKTAFCLNEILANAVDSSSKYHAAEIFYLDTEKGSFKRLPYLENKDTKQRSLSAYDSAMSLGLAGSFVIYYANKFYHILDGLGLGQKTYEWTVGGMPEFFTGAVGTRMINYLGKAAGITNYVARMALAAGVILGLGALDETYNLTNGTQDAMDIVKYALGFCLSAGACAVDEFRKDKKQP